MWIPLDDESANDRQQDTQTEESVLTTEDADTGNLVPDGTYNPNNPSDTENSNNDSDTDEPNDNESEYDVVVYCSCKAFWSSRAGHIVTGIFFTLLFVAALAAFCVVVQMIVVPYCRVALFQATNCSVTGASQLLIESHCTCSSGKGCSGDAQYTCLVIHVQYEDRDHGTQHNASIADNEVMLGQNCSFFPNCKASHAENLLQLKEYQDHHGRLQQIYSCFYNPLDHQQVIRAHRFRLHHVIHGLVWSTAFLVATSLVLIFVFIKLKRKRAMLS